MLLFCITVPIPPSKVNKTSCPKQSIVKTYQAAFAFSTTMLLTLTAHTHLFGIDVIVHKDGATIEKAERF